MIVNPSIVMHEDFDGCGILLNPETKQAVTLNRTAVLIWKSLQAGKSATEIAALIAMEFDVTEEKAAADAAQFIEQLKTRGMIRD
jgi:hypothetical protein